MIPIIAITSLDRARATVARFDFGAGQMGTPSPPILTIIITIIISSMLLLLLCYHYYCVITIMMLLLLFVITIIMFTPGPLIKSFPIKSP